MPNYELRDKDGNGMFTKYVECLPAPNILAGMYNDGCRLWINGKKLGKQEFYKFVEKLRKDNKDV